jgi:hypothetical protein
MLKKSLTPVSLDKAVLELAEPIKDFIKNLKLDENLSPCDKLISLEKYISKSIEPYYQDQPKMSEEEQKIDKNKKKINIICNKINGKSNEKGRCNIDAFAEYIESIYSKEQPDIIVDFIAPIIQEDNPCDLNWYKWLVNDLCYKKINVQKQINFLTHEIILKLGIAYYIGELFDQLLDSPGSINEEWATKLVYPSYKKGAKDDPSNYRPLTDNLLFTTKLLHNILAEQLNRLVTVKKKLNKSVQKGMNMGSSGVFDANMRFIKYVTKDKTGSIRIPIFLDIKNAYGSVNHQILFDVLLGHLIDHRILSYIKRVYELASAKIGNNKIPWNIGLFQGDPLSNVLYVIFKNAIIYEFCSVFNREDCMIAYIDDIVLLPNNIHEAKVMLFTFKKIIKKYRLACNMEKSGFLYIEDFNKQIPSERTFDKLSIGNFTINHFDDNIVKYLGSFMGTNIDIMFDYFLENQVVAKLDAIDSLKCSNDIKLHVYYRTVYSRITWDLQKFIVIFDKSKLSSIFQIEKFFIQRWSSIMSIESIDTFIEFRYKYIVMKSYQKITGSTDPIVNKLSSTFDSNVQYINKTVLNIAPPIDMLKLDGYDFNTDLSTSSTACDDNGDSGKSDQVSDLLGINNDSNNNIIEINIPLVEEEEQDDDQEPNIDPFEGLQNQLALLSINFNNININETGTSQNTSDNEMEV